MKNVVEFQPDRSNKINWHTIVSVIVFHVGAVWALFNFSWVNLGVFFLTWWLCASWGIGLGYHRLLTHRGFKTPKWFEYLLTFIGTLSLQSGPISWVTTHRLHHAFTETDKDPHTPMDSFFYGHIGWIFKGTAQIQPAAVMDKYSPDLRKDPVMRFMNDWYWVSVVIMAGVLYAIGGLPMVLWGVFLRIVATWHFTWLVNSWTHTWGTRRFDVRDTSTNSMFIALLTWGEGWHNNHHAHPRSARHGLTIGEIDFNWMQIKVFEKLGLMSDIYAYDINDEKTGGKEIRKAA